MNKLIQAKTAEIRQAMRSLGQSLEAGDESRLLYWVIPNNLACAHRPLRHHPLYGGSGQNVTLDAKQFVIDWVKRIQEEGIQSIISLMHEKDLSYYAKLDLESGKTLLDFYSGQGLRVVSLPWEDPHHSKTAEQEKEKTCSRICDLALIEYEKLYKPVLIQCSAGIDRSAPVAAFIHVNHSPVA